MPKKFRAVQNTESQVKKLQAEIDRISSKMDSLQDELDNIETLAIKPKKAILSQFSSQRSSLRKELYVPEMKLDIMNQIVSGIDNAKWNNIDLGEWGDSPLKVVDVAILFNPEFHPREHSFEFREFMRLIQQWLKLYDINPSCSLRTKSIYQIRFCIHAGKCPIQDFDKAEAFLLEQEPLLIRFGEHFKKAKEAVDKVNAKEISIESELVPMIKREIMDQIVNAIGVHAQADDSRGWHTVKGCQGHFMNVKVRLWLDQKFRLHVNYLDEAIKLTDFIAKWLDLYDIALSHELGGDGSDFITFTIPSEIHKRKAFDTASEFLLKQEELLALFDDHLKKALDDYTVKYSRSIDEERVNRPLLSKC